MQKLKTKKMSKTKTSYKKLKLKLNDFQNDNKPHTANKCIAKMQADGSRVSTFCFSIWLHIGQTNNYLAMCKSSTFIYKFSFR